MGDHVDNRFAFMRKYLGLSQSDAAELFSVRLDTVKKWDNGRLFVPETVLNSLFDISEETVRLIQAIAVEIEDGEEDEVFLHYPGKAILLDNNMPPSTGWVDHILGGVIAALPTNHVYVKKDAENDVFMWFDLWEWSAQKHIDRVTIKDEKQFSRDLARQVKHGTFLVQYDAGHNHYLVGIRTKAANGREIVVWLRVVRGDTGTNVFDDNELVYIQHEDSDIPYVEDDNGNQRTVGLGEGETSDCFALAELIFVELRARYSTVAGMRNACREIETREMSQLSDEDKEEATKALNEWIERSKFVMSRNFIVSLFLAFREMGVAAYPELLAQIAKIVQRSEPVYEKYDNQVICVDLDEYEVSIHLDLRDVIEAEKSEEAQSEEMAQAMKTIVAIIENEKVSTIPAYSEIIVEKTE